MARNLTYRYQPRPAQKRLRHTTETDDQPKARRRTSFEPNGRTVAWAVGCPQQSAAMMDWEMAANPMPCTAFSALQALSPAKPALWQSNDKGVDASNIRTVSLWLAPS